MHRLRKKYASSIVLFICLAAILLVGCQQTKAFDQHPTLKWDTEGAHPSLKAFEALEGRRFDGKAFSVKWIDLYQIPDAGAKRCGMDSSRALRSHRATTCRSL